MFVFLERHRSKILDTAVARDRVGIRRAIDAGLPGKFLREPGEIFVRWARAFAHPIGAAPSGGANFDHDVAIRTVMRRKIVVSIRSMTHQLHVG